MSAPVIISNLLKIKISDEEISHILGQVQHKYPRSSSRIIAANNASPLEKSGADKVCAGQSDHIMIQELLNAL